DVEDLARAVGSAGFQYGPPADLYEPELLSDLREGVERVLQVLPRVRRRDDGADARLVAGDGREGDPLREHPLLEEPVRQRHRLRAVAGDDRRDRALADPRVEPEALQAGLEEPRVLPEPLHDLRFLEQ